jgi:2-C-methyl-D-erythritol 4-phosphate cytidylyltransferase
VKRVAPDGAVVETLDRSELVRVQTPQGFRRGVLEKAHASALSAATDDAALVEAMGGRVVAVRGAEEAFKITTAWDLRVAEGLVR